MGYPPSHWTVYQDEVRHYPGHWRDSLTFRVPLEGNFQVDCELTSWGWIDMHLSYRGRVSVRGRI